MRLGVLGSTRGTHLHSLMKAIQDEQLQANIELVISNKDEALILEGAKKYGLPYLYVDPTGLSREDYDAKVSTLFQEKNVTLIVLIGYMRILSSSFVNAWQQKIINVHPSLLPAHAGLMDLGVHRSVLESKAAESGCTVHYVNETVDGGPILVQKRCYVLASDTPESLKERVQALEAAALVEAIKQCSHP